MAEGERMSYTQAQGKATQKYLGENMEQVRIWVHKGGKQALREAADAAGLSMAEYVCDAVNTKAGSKIITSKKEDG